MTIHVKNEQRIEGIRKTNAEGNEWVVVLSEPTPCSSHSGHPRQRTLITGATFRGRGARGRAIRAAGTNRVIEGAASALVAS